MSGGGLLKIVPVTGPPGAGKTTALMALDRQLPQLARFSVRDYGLWLAARGDPLGERMRDTLLRQELLSDELVRREFLHFLDNIPSDAVVVAVEGYPKDPVQCGDLVRSVRSREAGIAAFVMIDIPDDVVRDRVMSRRLCSICGIAAGISLLACPRCGGAIVRRCDDERSRLAHRLAEYREMSRQVQAYFAELGVLHCIDGMRPSDEVRALLTEILTAEGAILALQ